MFTFESSSLIKASSASINNVYTLQPVRNCVCWQCVCQSSYKTPRWLQSLSVGWFSIWLSISFLTQFIFQIYIQFIFSCRASLSWWLLGHESATAKLTDKSPKQTLILPHSNAQKLRRTFEFQRVWKYNFRKPYFRFGFRKSYDRAVSIG